MENILKNKTIVITRPADAGGKLKTMIEAQGGEAVLFPMIKIVPPANWQSCDRAIADLEKYDWIVFSSIHGANSFLQRLSMHKKEIKQQQIGCIGAAIASFLQQKRLKTALIPEVYSAAGFIEQLEKSGIKDKNFLLPVSNISREELAAGLQALGNKVDAVEVYQTVANTEIDSELLKKMLKNRLIDCLTFHSPSAFASFLSVLDRSTLDNIRQGDPPLAAIGKTTAAAMGVSGFTVSILPEHSSDTALVEAISIFFRQKKD